MSTQGRYKAPKRLRIDIPVPFEEKEEVERLAQQHFMTTGTFIKQLVIDGLKIWESK